jgi:ABC-2 type transport system ATP-binding protein
MLEIQNVYKRYKTKEVLSDVSFDIDDGCICGLLGLNGAGKSTIMKIISSLVYLDSGKVLIDGLELKKDDIINSSIGFMIENAAFYGSLTGRQNLTILASLYPNIPKERINEVLTITGMLEQANIKVSKYSLGMKQRLYFAYALINAPKILILDEPFNGIDPISVKIFRDLIVKLAKSGCCVLLSSHMIADIKSFCDKIVIIDKGKILLDKKISPEDDVENIFISLVSPLGTAQ